MDQIQHGKVVGMNYILKNSNGQELDRSDPLEPFCYLHGFDNIVIGLENALSGLKVGDKKSVTVEAREGYGEIIEELIMTVDRANFPADTVLTIGMQFQAQLQNQLVPFTKKNIDGDKINVDGNHPLAGEKLFFEVEIHSLRDASGEEKEHGHPHGPGGHSH
jgi:FKBP-type peptidyl-prolyl cis-trans isomerase SlyD